jgi:hypothetical protein
MITANETPFTVHTTLVPVTCHSCAVVFGIEKELQKRRLNDGESFFCTNGHSQAYCDTEADRLRKQLKNTEDCLKNSRDEAQRQRNLKEATERSLRGTKAVVTRMKRRVVKGQCVCCSRKFKDLATHMKVEHPDWNPDKAAEALAAKP